MDMPDMKEHMKKDIMIKTSQTNKVPSGAKT